MRGFKRLCAVVLVLLSAPAAWAAHAYGQFGDIKYPPGFAHFDYVNPAAPKGGEIRMVPPTRPTILPSSPCGPQQAGWGAILSANQPHHCSSRWQ